MRRNLNNRARKSELKTLLRECTDKLVHSKPAEAEKVIGETICTLDRAGNRGTIHRNAAARRKSRLMRKLNALKKAKTGT